MIGPARSPGIATEREEEGRKIISKGACNANRGRKEEEKIREGGLTSVCDLLDERASRAQSRRGDVSSGVEPQDDGDGVVESDREALAAEHGLVVVARVSHLWKSRGENEREGSASCTDQGRGINELNPPAAMEKKPGVPPKAKRRETTEAMLVGGKGAALAKCRRVG
jgi:hypothetical protein